MSRDVADLVEFLTWFIPGLALYLGGVLIWAEIDSRRSEKFWAEYEEEKLRLKVIADAERAKQEIAEFLELMAEERQELALLRRELEKRRDQIDAEERHDQHSIALAALPNALKLAFAHLMPNERRTFLVQTLRGFLGAGPFPAIQAERIPDAELDEFLGVWSGVWAPHRLDPVVWPSHGRSGRDLRVGSNRWGGVYLSREEYSTHCHYLGRTGCGKTNVLLQYVEHCIANGWTVVVIDYRGELVDRMLARLLLDDSEELGQDDQWEIDPFRKELLSRLCLVDYRDESNIVGHNPLQGPGGFYTCGMQTLDAIRDGSDSWGVSIEHTMRNCLFALAEAGLSLVELPRLLQDDAFRAKTLLAVTDDNVRAFFADFEEQSPAQRRLLVPPVLNKVLPHLSIPIFRRTLGAPNVLDWKALLDRRPGSIVLVALGANRWGSAAAGIGKTLVNRLRNEILSRPDVSNSPPAPVYIVLDEFENMASSDFLTFLSESRKYGASLALAHQGYAQLSKELKEAIEINCRMRLLFATGVSDSAHLAPEIRSISEDPREDLMGLDTGEAYLICRPRQPKLVETDYFQEPRVPSDRIEFLRAASNRRYALSAAEVDAEIEARSASASEASADRSASKEVRHGKRPSL